MADVQTRKIVREWDEESVCAFSPDSRWMVTGGEECRVWTVGSWERPVKTLPHKPGLGRVLAAAYRGDGKLLALAYSSRDVRLVDPESGHELASLTAPFPLPVRSLSFSSNGDYLVVGCANHTVQVWNLRMVAEQLTQMGLGWEDHGTKQP